MSYEPIDYILMFLANFAVVFLLGLQSRNVVAGKVVAAVLTSFGISIANFTFVKYAATGGPSVFVLCALGGCCGIATSIWFYENVVQKRRAQSEAEAYFPLTPAMKNALERFAASHRATESTGVK